jgi:uncharacterized protein (TIGR02145 family)
MRIINEYRSKLGVLKLYLLILAITMIQTSCKKLDVTRILKIQTGPVSEISYTTSVAEGFVFDVGNEAITQHGHVWAPFENPTLADAKTELGNRPSKGSYVSFLEGLKPGTEYFVRAYAMNASGISYGNQRNFFTEDARIFDVDGNEYAIVPIGSQIWMAENLRTTKYNDGESIPMVTDDVDWSSIIEPAYCWYENDKVNHKYPYGALYNYYAVNTGKLCPEGWHVPSEAEWETLIDHLDGHEMAGGKLKETGFSHWITPNTGATNESGFTALPAGTRRPLDGIFQDLGNYANWWTSTEYGPNPAQAHNYFINNTSANIYHSWDYKNFGFSVRCIKD